MMKGSVPPTGSSQWKKNEKTINENPTLKKARDRTEGFNVDSKAYSASHGGKGSAMRPGDKKAYAEGWDRIFGNKDKTDE